MRIDVNSLGLGDQILTNFALGFGLALVNVLLRYFVPFVPRMLSITYWHNAEKRSTYRTLIFAFSVLLLLQMITSPIFKSAFQSVYQELAWSPYQALWNLIGILTMDLFVYLWTRGRGVGKASGAQLESIKARAADTLDEVGVNIAMTAEQRAAAEERKRQEEADRAAALAESKQRLNDKLKDY
jgi:Na+/proline symporter